MGRTQSALLCFQVSIWQTSSTYGAGQDIEFVMEKVGGSVIVLTFYRTGAQSHSGEDRAKFNASRLRKRKSQTTIRVEKTGMIAAE